MPINSIALAQKISRQSVWQIKKKFETYGLFGLKDQKIGRPFEPLNKNYWDLVVDLWNENRCGTRKLYAISKQRGFSVSRRKIERVLIAEGLQKPNEKRRKPRKYKRYEWPIANYMWHCDWHIIKNERMRGENLLVFLDDSTRKIMSFIVGDMTTKNSLFALYKAISEHNVIPYCLNSDRGTQFFPNKKDKNGKASHEFQIALEEVGISFIPSKKRHPQTNGKNEKWFDIFEREFDERFKTVEEFVDWYNDKRLSEALNYKTPNKTYKNRL